MCLAIPAKITKIKNSIATVKYPQNDDKQAKIITGSYKPGDYVIVQAGLVIEKVPKKQVEMWNQFIKIQDTNSPPSADQPQADNNQITNSKQF